MDVEDEAARVIQRSYRGFKNENRKRRFSRRASMRKSLSGDTDDASSLGELPSVDECFMQLLSAVDDEEVYLTLQDIEEHSEAAYKRTTQPTLRQVMLSVVTNIVLAAVDLPVRQQLLSLVSDILLHGLSSSHQNTIIHTLCCLYSFLTAPSISSEKFSSSIAETASELGHIERCFALFNIASLMKNPLLLTGICNVMSIVVKEETHAKGFIGRKLLKPIHVILSEIVEEDDEKLKEGKYSSELCDSVALLLATLGSHCSLTLQVDGDVELYLSLVTCNFNYCRTSLVLNLIVERYNNSGEGESADFLQHIRDCDDSEKAILTSLHNFSTPDSDIQIMSRFINIFLYEEDVNSIKGKNDSVFGDQFCRKVLRGLLQIIKSKSKGDSRLPKPRSYFVLLSCLRKLTKFCEHAAYCLVDDDTGSVLSVDDVFHLHSFLSKTGTGSQSKLDYAAYLTLLSVIRNIYCSGDLSFNSQLRSCGIEPDPSLNSKLSQSDLLYVNGDIDVIADAGAFVRCCIKIQAFYRGILGRRRAAEHRKGDTFLLNKSTHLLKTHKDGSTEMQLEEHEERSKAAESFEEEWEIIVTGSRHIEFQRTLLRKEISLRNNQARQKLLYTHESNRGELVLQEKETLSKLSNLHVAELEEIKDSEQDAMQLPDDQRQIVLTSLSNRKDLLLKQQLQARVDMRHALSQQRDKLTQVYEAERNRMVHTQDKYYDYHIIEIEEERYRGLGQSDRESWWGSCSLLETNIISVYQEEMNTWLHMSLFIIGDSVLFANESYKREQHERQEKIIRFDLSREVRSDIHFHQQKAVLTQESELRSAIVDNWDCDISNTTIPDLEYLKRWFRACKEVSNHLDRTESEFQEQLHRLTVSEIESRLQIELTSTYNRTMTWMSAHHVAAMQLLPVEESTIRRRIVISEDEINEIFEIICAEDELRSVILHNHRRMFFVCFGLFHSESIIQKLSAKQRTRAAAIKSCEQSFFVKIVESFSRKLRVLSDINPAVSIEVMPYTAMVYSCCKVDAKKSLLLKLFGASDRPRSIVCVVAALVIIVTEELLYEPPPLPVKEYSTNVDDIRNNIAALINLKRLYFPEMPSDVLLRETITVGYYALTEDNLGIHVTNLTVRLFFIGTLAYHVIFGHPVAVSGVVIFLQSRDPSTSVLRMTNTKKVNLNTTPQLSSFSMPRVTSSRVPVLQKILLEESLMARFVNIHQKNGDSNSSHLTVGIRLLIDNLPEHTACKSIVDGLSIVNSIIIPTGGRMIKLVSSILFVEISLNQTISLLDKLTSSLDLVNISHCIAVGLSNVNSNRLLLKKLLTTNKDLKIAFIHKDLIDWITIPGNKLFHDSLCKEGLVSAGDVEGNANSKLFQSNLNRPMVISGNINNVTEEQESNNVISKSSNNNAAEFSQRESTDFPLKSVSLNNSCGDANVFSKEFDNQPVPPREWKQSDGQVNSSGWNQSCKDANIFSKECDEFNKTDADNQPIPPQEWKQQEGPTVPQSDWNQSCKDANIFSKECDEFSKTDTDNLPVPPQQWMQHGGQHGSQVKSHSGWNQSCKDANIFSKECDEFSKTDTDNQPIPPQEWKQQVPSSYSSDEFFSYHLPPSTEEIVSEINTNIDSGILPIAYGCSLPVASTSCVIEICYVVLGDEILDVIQEIKTFSMKHDIRGYHYPVTNRSGCLLLYGIKSSMDSLVQNNKNNKQLFQLSYATASERNVPHNKSLQEIEILHDKAEWLEDILSVLADVSKNTEVPKILRNEVSRANDIKEKNMMSVREISAAYVIAIMVNNNDYDEISFPDVFPAEFARVEHMGLLLVFLPPIINLKHLIFYLSTMSTNKSFRISISYGSLLLGLYNNKATATGAAVMSSLHLLQASSSNCCLVFAEDINECLAAAGCTMYQGGSLTEFNSEYLNVTSVGKTNSIIKNIFSISVISYQSMRELIATNNIVETPPSTKTSLSSSSSSCNEEEINEVIEGNNDPKPSIPLSKEQVEIEDVISDPTQVIVSDGVVKQDPAINNTHQFINSQRNSVASEVFDPPYVALAGLSLLLTPFPGIITRDGLGILKKVTWYYHPYDKDVDPIIIDSDVISSPTKQPVKSKSSISEKKTITETTHRNKPVQKTTKQTIQKPTPKQSQLVAVGKKTTSKHVVEVPHKKPSDHKFAVLITLIQISSQPVNTGLRHLLRAAASTMLKEANTSNVTVKGSDGVKKRNGVQSMPLLKNRKTADEIARDEHLLKMKRERMQKIRQQQETRKLVNTEKDSRCKIISKAREAYTDIKSDWETLKWCDHWTHLSTPTHAPSMGSPISNGRYAESLVSKNPTSAGANSLTTTDRVSGVHFSNKIYHPGNTEQYNSPSPLPAVIMKSNSTDVVTYQEEQHIPTSPEHDVALTRERDALLKEIRTQQQLLDKIQTQECDFQLRSLREQKQSQLITTSLRQSHQYTDDEDEEEEEPLSIGNLLSSGVATKPVAKIKKRPKPETMLRQAAYNCGTRLPLTECVKAVPTFNQNAGKIRSPEVHHSLGPLQKTRQWEWGSSPAEVFLEEEALRHTRLVTLQKIKEQEIRKVAMATTPVVKPFDPLGYNSGWSPLYETQGPPPFDLSPPTPKWKRGNKSYKNY